MRRDESVLPWLHHIRDGAGPGGGRFIYFPAAGSSASSGWGLSAAVPEEWSLWSVQYPARGPRVRDPLPGSIREMARACRSVLSAQAHRSLLFGHSFGAYVAYDVAQLLESDGSPAAGLLVSGIPAPGSALRSLSADELTDASLMAFLAREGTTAPDVLADAEMMELVLPVLRTDLAIARRYIDDHGRRLSTAIIAMCGRNDRLVAAEELDGWRHLSRRWLGCASAEGDHFTYLDESSLLKDVLRRHWSQVCEGGSG